MIASGGNAPAPGFPRILVIPGPAARLLRKLPPNARRPMLDALETYAATGAGDVRRLMHVRPPEYRLRVGEYRARFELTGAGIEAAVIVLWVGNRRDAY